MLRVSGVILAFVALIAVSGAQDVVGVKSTAGLGASNPPAGLYTFPFGAGPLVPMGPVTMTTTGVQIDIDGLAMDDMGHLMGFWLGPGISQLVQIDPATQIATPRPHQFLGIEMRGACFDAAGRLWAIDATNDAVVQVNPITGAPIGPATPLTMSGFPFIATDACDIATFSGGVLLVRHNGFYRLNLFSGALTTEYGDPVPGPDGLSLLNVGLAIQGPAVFTADSNGTDDVFTYHAGPWTRALKYLNIIPATNSGRGDLASRPRRVPVRGSVRLGQWSQPEEGMPALIEIQDEANNVYERHFVTLGPGGSYEVFTSLEGTFQVLAKASHWLRRGRVQEIGPEGASSVDFMLINGDADGDNEVGPGDFGRLAHSFGSSLGGPRYDPSADFDGDEEVGPQDFGILSSNFGESGD